MQLLLIEDDIIQSDNLSNLIKESYNNVELLKAHSVNESLKIISEKSIDLFFIDINLPDGSGIDLAKNIRSMEGYELRGIVFITSQGFQMVDAFKNIHCYDFLIKPYSKEDIIRIIDVFTKENVKKNGNRKYSIISIENKITYKLYHDDIVFVEYIPRKCKIVTAKNGVIYAKLSLAKFLSMIESNSIVQCHKSFIVNTKYIKKIDKLYTKLWKIHFINIGEVVDLSISYSDKVFEILGYENEYK
ncbi:LytTR family DNA-binding domain-containing protein [Clostridium sp.]|uniref:LytR/AlgR family response regulator transcription factor n=1 Tax=Clostridium sp. TaxID=1506 RepID=UPI0032166B96